MALSDEDIAQKILARCPDFENESDLSKVAEVVKWVCDDGYANSIVSSSIPNTLRIESVTCVIMETTLETSQYIFYNHPLNTKYRMNSAIHFYRGSCYVRQVIVFMEYIKSIAPSDRYCHLKTFSDAKAYLKNAIDKNAISIAAMLDNRHPCGLIAQFYRPAFMHINSSRNAADIPACVQVIMEYYNYFYMEYQDVKVAQD